MSQQTPVQVVPHGTVGFERKVQVRDYESASASIYLPFDIDPENEAATAQAAKDAFFTAQSVVLEQLGIAFEYDEAKGIVRELLTAKFGPVTEVAASGNGNGSVTQAAPAASGNPNCPKCNGAMYDNRADNAARIAQGKRAQPDFRCKQYKQPPAGTGCDGVVWPKR